MADNLSFDNDELRFMNPFTLIRVQSRAVMYFCFIVTIYAIVTSCVGFWILMTYYPSENLTTYICIGTFFISQVNILLMYTYSRKKYRKLVEESHTKFRAAHSEGGVGYRQILVYVNNLKILHAATMFPVLVLNLYCISNKQLRSNYMFFVISDRGFCGEFCWLMEIANYVTMQVLWLPQYWFLSVHLYGTGHLSIQVMLLKRHISKSLEFTKRIHIDDAVMQEKCRKCLKGVVKFHMDIKSHSDKCMEMIARVGIIIFTPGILVVVSSLYCTLLIRTMEIKIFSALILLFLVWAAYLAGRTGQILTDESDGLLFCFYDCAWFNWNKQNCRTLIIAMANVMKPMAITFFQLVNIDHMIIIKLFRLSYAMLTCLLNLSGDLVTSAIDVDQ